MKFLVLAGLAFAVLAGCTPRDALTFDGQYYRTGLKSKVNGDRRHFAVTAKPVSASFLGAREAARYEATNYCVLNYGSSDIDWIVGPDSDPQAIPLDGDTLILRGICPE